MPATLLVSVNTASVGQPTSASQSIAAVGPTVSAGSPALAESGNSLVSEVQYGSVIDWSEWLAAQENLANGATSAREPATDLAVVQARARAEANPEHEADGALRRSTGAWSGRVAGSTRSPRAKVADARGACRKNPDRCGIAGPGNRARRECARLDKKQAARTTTSRTDEF